jgi:ATP:corrinoid adenosyltransferase
LVQKADRLIEDKKVPLVIIDEAEEEINLGLLQFPLWLAYAPEPQQMSSYYY